MSNENITMDDLLKRQEAQRKDLAAGAYNQWLPVKEKEEKLLAPFEGNYENAFPEVQAEINEGRKAYFQEWGSEGKLAVLMTARHTKEREKLIERQDTLTRIKEITQRNKDNDRER